eukprot:2117599-Rhodomonas_salina.3
MPGPDNSCDGVLKREAVKDGRRLQNELQAQVRAPIRDRTTGSACRVRQKHALASSIWQWCSSTVKNWREILVCYLSNQIPEHDAVT